ncbi:TIGR04282 family arsenosugar biosynthesis glycosyltransferase [Paracraurococcus lichenis]|uniref:TIGR04282 family arsenosugar biosynthesis glycosyltransferase n=1 Tax=Paracraurococcus lichenis TaxID=3064888 RepID=A0ABT9E4C2_9PROT|nr:TIGR04282 family arsenosugar biosynthesis glycosyltransferase [Paracraurococcus sp. LOR1-02]MDO9710984.1 TIGR04282 family arsenosugar biosynthesis glycosyltransferase [Paracraurococcus sp. LOR1-02]
MRGDTLIVFARAPRLGTVKRRLAAGIGDMAALRFYKGQLRRMMREVGRDRRWRTVLAVTPDRPRWPTGLAAVGQGRGDLGQRMGRALARHRRAVLVGCDIPGLKRADVAAAFRALGRAQAVFGPAEDGGYWLVGFGPRRPPAPFARVRWSTEHALADTLANCRGHRIALLRRLRDVDTAADLRALGPPREGG